MMTCRSRPIFEAALFCILLCSGSQHPSSRLCPALPGPPCHTPWMSGCPSGVRGGFHDCPATETGAHSATMTMMANMHPQDRVLIRALLREESYLSTPNSQLPTLLGIGGWRLGVDIFF